MTRDQKLALILGFVVFVAVAVVIGDFLSTASRANLIGIDGDRAVDEFATVQTSTVARRPEPLGVLPKAQQPASTTGGPEAGLAQGGSSNPASTWPDETEAKDNPAVPQGPLHIAQVGQRTDQQQSGQSGTGTSDGGEPSSRLPGTRPGPNSRYLVQEGDTLSAIAVKHYGDPRLWRSVQQFNALVVPDPDKLLPGIWLELPPLGSLGGAGPAPEGLVEVPARREPTRADDAAARQLIERERAAERDRSRGPANRPELIEVRDRPRPEPSPVEPGGYRLYTVRAGDTLSVIAQRELKTIRRIGEIVALNERLQKNPDRLVAGTKIRLPAS